MEKFPRIAGLQRPVRLLDSSSVLSRSSCGLGCGELPTASWPKSARVYCGYRPGPIRVIPPPRQGGGGTRAPPLTYVTASPWRTLKQLFNVTEKLIRDLKEITGIPVINWQRQRTTLLTDKAVQFATAKTCVFSVSVLCMGRISGNPVRAWKEKYIGF